MKLAGLVPMSQLVGRDPVIEAAVVSDNVGVENDCSRWHDPGGIQGDGKHSHPRKASF